MDDMNHISFVLYIQHLHLYCQVWFGILIVTSLLIQCAVCSLSFEQLKIQIYTHQSTVIEWIWRKMTKCSQLLVNLSWLPWSRSKGAKITCFCLCISQHGPCISLLLSWNNLQKWTVSLSSRLFAQLLSKMSTRKWNSLVNCGSGAVAKTCSQGIMQLQ